MLECGIPGNHVKLNTVVPYNSSAPLKRWKAETGEELKTQTSCLVCAAAKRGALSQMEGKDWQ